MRRAFCRSDHVQLICEGIHRVHGFAEGTGDARFGLVHGIDVHLEFAGDILGGALKQRVHLKGEERPGAVWPGKIVVPGERERPLEALVFPDVAPRLFDGRFGGIEALNFVASYLEAITEADLQLALGAGL